MTNMLRTPQVAARPQLPQTVVAWLDSEQGRKAVSAALQESQADVTNLAQDRRVELERLHTPITL